MQVESVFTSANFGKSRSCAHSLTETEGFNLGKRRRRRVCGFTCAVWKRFILVGSIGTFNWASFLKLVLCLQVIGVGGIIAG